MPLALITGAAKRVGKDTALTLARLGFDLILHARSSREDAQQTQAEIEALGQKAEFFFADLAKHEERLRFAQEVLDNYPKIDVIINNAAIYEGKAFADISYQEYQQMQAINLEAPFFVTQQLLPALKAAASNKARPPQVIFIADMAVDRPYAGHAHYLLSKSGVATLTRCLALELAPEIKVNAVAPGWVMFTDEMNAEFREKVAQEIPLQQIGTGEDIAETIAFLLTKAPFINGQIIRVDGGVSAR